MKELKKLYESIIDDAGFLLGPILCFCLAVFGVLFACASVLALLIWFIKLMFS